MKEENQAEIHSLLKTVIKQLNESLTSASKKNKVMQSNIVDNQEKLNSLQKQFNDYVTEMEEKIERVLNTNADVGASIKKSMNRNIGDYAVELKSSINEIPSSAIVDEIRN